jgi:hypothetical protein
MALMEMVEWEVSPKKKKQCSVERYARLQIAFVQLQTEYKNEAGNLQSPAISSGSFVIGGLQIP